MKKMILSLVIFSCYQVALANVVGVDTQNFNPITSGLDFVTVQSSETLEPGLVNFGFFLNYASNTLPSYDPNGSGSRTNSKDRLLSSDFNLGVGLMKNWDAGISFPSVVSQEVEAGVLKGVFERSGLTDIRLNTKFRFTGDKDGGFAVIGTLELPQVENNPFYGSGGGPTYNIELAADTTYNKVALGANLGYRVRNPGSPIPGVSQYIQPIDDMYIASVAGSYLFESIDTKLISEIFTSFPVKGTATQTAKELSSQEWLIGAKHDLNSEVALHAGVSTEMGQGTSSPDWRIYGGVNWTLGPLWGKEEPVEVVQAPQEIPPLPSAPPTAEPLIAPMTTMTTDAEQEQFPEARVPEKREVFIVKNINFSTASNKIPTKFKNYLRKISKYLMKEPKFTRMVISGHTDSVGPADYNRKLSEARAATTKRAFVELYGLPADRIEVEGFGEDKPVADNGNYQGRARNRRVEFYIER